MTKITGRNNTEEETFGLCEGIIDNMFAGVCFVGLKDLSIKHVSSRFAEMFGFTVEELIGKDALAVGVPIDKNLHKIAKNVVGSIQKTGSWRGELQNTKKDGSLLYCDAKFWFLKHKKYGDILFCLYLDITKQKQFEEKLLERTKELEKERNIFSDIIEYNPYSIIISDKDGNVLRVNKAFINYFKTMPPPEYTIFNDPNIKKHKVEYLYARLRKGETIVLPAIWFNPRQDINSKLPSVDMYMATTIFPLKDKEGNVVHYITIHKDLTQQKKAEDILKEKIDELEKINKFMVDRELKMIELKEKIKKLENKK